MKEKLNQSVQILSDETLSEVAGGISEEAKEVLTGGCIGAVVGITLGFMIKYIVSKKQ